MADHLTQVVQAMTLRAWAVCASWPGDAYAACVCSTAKAACKRHAGHYQMLHGSMAPTRHVVQWHVETIAAVAATAPLPQQ